MQMQQAVVQASGPGLSEPRREEDWAAKEKILWDRQRNFTAKMQMQQQSVHKASGSGLSEPPEEEEERAAKVVRFMDDNKVSELPKSPNCPALIELYLQGNSELTAIPPLFFKRMARLQVLDLSHTSIKSLPKSLPKLVALKKLLLRGCELFMKLSPHVGRVKNLEELDLDQTQIMDLPKDIGKLFNLRHLRVSFYPICGKKMSKSNILIHPDTMSILSQLAGLSIDVDPTDKRWDDSVEAVVKGVCNSKTLTTLRLYLPKFQLLGDLSSTYPSLSQFGFTVGHHKRRIISRVPHEVEAEFQKWDKCLKFVNGENIPIEIKGVLRHSASFFLDHHATAMNLSEFGVENMKMLKFCLLAECNKMETVIDGERPCEGNEDDGSESDPSSGINVLESLEYFSIYYMENLGSIWRGPISYGCMSRLKVLALHTCPRLIHICTPALLGNFVNLEDLILEDCPQLTSLVSHASVKSPFLMSYTFLPSLKRLLLLYLPELVSISNGLPIAPHLEIIGFYNCSKLKSISKKELSSKSLKIIKGESKWWEDMKWNETEWGNRPDYLMQIFSPINNEKDVMTQLAEDRDLFEATIENEIQQLEERTTGIDVPKSSPFVRIPPPPLSAINFSAPEQAWSFSSEKNKRLEDDQFDLTSDEDEPKAKRWNCNENKNKGVKGSATNNTTRGDLIPFITRSEIEIPDETGHKWRKYGGNRKKKTFPVPVLRSCNAEAMLEAPSYLVSRDMPIVCEDETRRVYNTFGVFELPRSKRRVDDGEDQMATKILKPQDESDKNEGEKKDMSLAQTDQPNHTQRHYKDHSESFSLIHQLGRDHSISCLIRCSRSDYGSIACLNKAFRSLIQSGELYKLRRLMGIAEHWVYLSCNLQEWEAFDPIRRRWMHLPKLLSDECFTFSDKESLAVGTQLLVFGRDLTSHVIYKYSILTNTWSSGMTMNTPRCLFGSASLGKIAILAGGCDRFGNTLNSAELYNSETGEWETIPSMNKPRKLCSAVFMDGNFYVVGGIWERDLQTCGEVYDLKTKTWHLIPAMFTVGNSWIGPTKVPIAAGAPPSLAVVNNELYTADFVQKEVKKYDKEQNLWVALGELPESVVGVNGWGVWFGACGDGLIVVGGPRKVGEETIELYSWVPNESPPQWELLASKVSGSFVYNCAVMGC